MTRIDQIKNLLAKGEEPFLLYSLAMELAARNQTDEAMATFNRCLEADPAYLPAYVEAGKTLRAAGRLGEARAMFQAGLELAAKKGEAHMRDYIQQQLEALPRPDART
jgi:tetratricopeptide (TPR) repeat protein